MASRSPACLKSRGQNTVSSLQTNRPSLACFRRSYCSGVWITPKLTEKLFFEEYFLKSGERNIFFIKLKEIIDILHGIYRRKRRFFDCRKCGVKPPRHPACLWPDVGTEEFDYFNVRLGRSCWINLPAPMHRPWTANWYLSTGPRPRHNQGGRTTIWAGVLLNIREYLGHGTIYRNRYLFISLFKSSLLVYMMEQSNSMDTPAHKITPPSMSVWGVQTCRFQLMTEAMSEIWVDNPSQCRPGWCSGPGHVKAAVT